MGQWLPLLASTKVYGILFLFLGPCGLTSLVTSDLHGSEGVVASTSESSLPLLCLTLLEREPTRARRRLFLLGLTLSVLVLAVLAVAVSVLALVLGGGVFGRGLTCVRV